MPDQISTSDHDLIITLVETVKNNNSVVLEKFSDIKMQIESVNLTIMPKVENHEKRIREIEQWQSNFKATWKFIVGSASIIGSVVSFIIMAILYFLNYISSLHK